MAWRPWYEEMAEMNSAKEREDFVRGVFGPPQVTGKKLAGMALTALLIGWGVNQVQANRKK